MFTFYTTNRACACIDLPGQKNGYYNLHKEKCNAIQTCVSFEIE